jgi:PD-(D/E)XK nuclease superfamily
MREQIDLKHSDLTDKIIGVFYDVYNELGYGFLEPVYEEAHEAQLLHYLKATEIEVGLLLNFGSRPQFRRLLYGNQRKKIRENPCESVAGVSL